MSASIQPDTAAPERSLDALVETVNREHRLAVQAGMSMVGHAMAAGDALLAAKRLMPHGQWGPWLVERFPDKHPKTLRFYMRLAKYRDQVEAANPPTIAAAHQLLAGEAVRPYEDAAKAEARRMRREDGATYVQISAMLGVSYESVREWCDPRRAESRRRRRNAETRAARRALHRSRREQAARSAGGAIAEAYASLRRTLQAVEAAGQQEGDREAKAALVLAQQRLYAAEDLISKAVRLHDTTEAAA
jgi:hypothetical protein